MSLKDCLLADPAALVLFTFMLLALPSSSFPLSTRSALAGDPICPAGLTVRVPLLVGPLITNRSSSSSPSNRSSSPLAFEVDLCASLSDNASSLASLSTLSMMDLGSNGTAAGNSSASTTTGEEGGRGDGLVTMLSPSSSSPPSQIPPLIVNISTLPQSGEETRLAMHLVAELNYIRARVAVRKAKVVQARSSINNTALSFGLELGNVELATIYLRLIGTLAGPPVIVVGDLTMGNFVGNPSDPSFDSNVNSCLYRLEKVVGSFVSFQFPGRNVNAPRLIVIEGSLIVVSNSKLSALSMPLLTSVNFVSVRTNPFLTSVDFSSLEEVFGTFSIQQCTSLKFVNLPLLHDVARNVEIINNPALIEINITSLASAYTVSISSNPSLTSLNFNCSISTTLFQLCGSSHDYTLPECFGRFGDAAMIPGTRCDGDCFCPSYIGDIQVDELTPSSAFAISSVLGSVLIEETGLSVFVGWDALKTISGGLSVSGNNFLKNVTFSQLFRISGSLSVNTNQRLQYFYLPALAYVEGSFQIVSNPLVGLVQFPFLSEVKRARFEISSCNNITVLHFPQLASAAYIIIGSNLKLVNISFPSVAQVTQMKVSGNPSLLNVSLPSLKQGSNNSGIQFSSNVGLNFLDLRKLESVVGNLEISDSPFLRAVDLTSLQFVSVSLIFRQLSVLKSINLPSLVTASSGLLIETMVGLESLVAPQLKIARSIHLDTLASLTLFDITAAETLGLYIQRCPKLVNISAPALTAAYELIFDSNDKLTSIDLPKVVVSNSLSIVACPQLTQLNLPNLALVRYSGDDSVGFYFVDSPGLKEANFPALEAILCPLYFKSLNQINFSFPQLQNITSVSLDLLNQSSLSFPALRMMNYGLSMYRCRNTTLSVPSLETIGKVLLISACYGSQLFSFPSLVSVKDTLKLFSNHQIQTFDFPVLETVYSGFVIENNFDLMNVYLPSLESPVNVFSNDDDLQISADFEVRNNSQLVLLSCPRVIDIGASLLIENNAALKEISFASLKTIGFVLSISQNPSLEVISFPSLELTGSHALIRWVPSLRSLDLNMLYRVQGTFMLNEATSLHQASFPSLVTVDSAVIIQGCSSLESVFFPLLVSGDGVALVSLNNLANATFSSLNVLKNTGILVLKNQKLFQMSFPRLETTIGTIEITTNANLSVIQFPMLRNISSGSLSVQNSSFLTSISFPALQSVKISLLFAFVRAPLLSFPSLETVPQTFIIHDSNIVTIDFSVLGSVSYISLYSLSVSQLMFPQLATVKNSFLFFNIWDLPQLIFPVLSSVSSLTVAGFMNTTLLSLPLLKSALVSIAIHSHPVLRNISMPALAAASSLDLDSNDMLEAISFPSLEDTPLGFFVANNLRLAKIDTPLLSHVGETFLVSNNSALLYLYFPKLDAVEGTFVIEKNALLESVQFPSLYIIDGSFTVVENPQLELPASTCPALRSISGFTTVCNNTAVASIPACIANSVPDNQIILLSFLCTGPCKCN